MSIKVQHDATIQFILSVNCSTCFGRFFHPSSGAQITVFTASGTGQPLLLSVTIMEELRLLSVRYGHLTGTTAQACSLGSNAVL